MNLDAAKHVKFFMDILEDQDDTAGPLDISQIGGTHFKKSHLEKLSEFCNYLTKNDAPSIPKPLKHMNLRNVIAPWYASFVEDMADEELYEMAMVADRLICQPLLDLISAYIAVMIQEKNIFEVRDFFEIDGDLDPDDLIRIDDENKKIRLMYFIDRETD